MVKFVVASVNILSIAIIQFHTNAQTVCHDSESCMFFNLTTGSTDLECYGYRSCEQASIISTDGGNIKCYGSYSCYDATNIIVTSESSYAPVWCFGLSSCARAETILTDRGETLCYGEQSCCNTKIQSLSSTANVRCDGDHSCANTEIISGGNNYFGANLAALNAILYSNDSSVEYEFQGFESGLNTTIICGDGNDCNIKCFGNGCKELKSQCKNQTCNVDIDCEYAEYDEINCPSGYKIPSDIIIPSLLNIEMSTLANSYNLYNLSSIEYNCDDYHDSQCLDQAINTKITNPSPIWCTARQSCESANMSATISSIHDNIAIRCDGTRSCEQCSRIVSSHMGAGNVYATGDYSAIGESGQMQLLSTSTDYDIFCTAYRACENRYFRTGKNLYCTAYEACGNAKLIHDFENVYAYGMSSLYGANWIASVENIYCGGYGACNNSKVSDVYDSVYGNNYAALSHSQISNVRNSVVGLGFQSLYASKIYNVTNVYCIGERSCSNSIIRGIHNKIEANGNNTLSSSVIISESNFNNSGTLYIFINGTNNNTFDIYCNETDTCEIYCQSSDACTTLSVACGSSPSRCYVKCDEENGISCPYNGSFNQLNSSVPGVPTRVPSGAIASIPTTYPTTIPTAIPTTIPSDTPTAIPMPVPTAIPTLIPTGFPTTFPTTVPTSVPTAIPTETLSTETSSVSTFVSTNSSRTTHSNTSTTTITTSRSIGTSGTTMMNDGIASLSSTSDSNDNSSDFSNENNPVFVILVIIIGVLLCCCIVVLFFSCHLFKKLKSNDSHNPPNEILYSKSSLTGSKKVRGSGRLGSKNTNPVPIYGANGERINLQGDTLNGNPQSVKKGPKSKHDNEALFNDIVHLGDEKFGQQPESDKNESETDNNNSEELYTEKEGVQSPTTDNDTHATGNSTIQLEKRNTNID